ncbi:Tannase/feruloyl esterase [Xylariales sp. PMI_506]|nr:Tannase/feruloyl esterase [Xylariales sp. PMI_506]
MPTTRAAAKACAASTFQPYLPAAASIERVASIQQGGTFGEGITDLGYPLNATNLPALCAVIVDVVSTSTSRYRFGMFLPTSIWNGRMLTVGNGGFVGGIDWREMGAGSQYGFATINTDTGHNSSSGDLSWGYEAPEVIADWGWRSINGSVALGKVLVEAFYQDDISYSYYQGCSTGGRQGLKEIQINAEAFDGALIGSPAWDTAGLMPWLTRLGALDLPATDPKAFTTLAQFQLLAATVLSQCDALDGVVDNIVSDPESCVPDFTVIECGAAGVDADNCITPEQIVTAQTIYADYYTESGDFVYNGLEVSSENQWDTYQLYGDASNFDSQWEKYFLYNDLSFTWEDYNDTVAEDARRLDPGNCTADQYDISPFKERGGKIIMYQGLSDGIVASRSATTYYNRTQEIFGSEIDDFFRYFQIPGMQHCFTSPAGVNAPWMIAGWGQQAALGAYTTYYSVPGFIDAQHDALLALVDWVENGTAVDSIIATAWNVTTANTLAVYRQRPLCPYPQKATYKGTGNVNAATSWACE